MNTLMDVIRKMGMAKYFFYSCLAVGLMMGMAMSRAHASPSGKRSEEAHGASAAPSANLRYTLGPLDVLEITLYGRPELGREVTLSQQGAFRFPLIGEVQARGLTVAQLEKALTQRLQRARVSSPHVAVTVKVYHSDHVFVLGQVQAPGAYALPAQADLRELILRAHGFTPEADDFLIVIDGGRQSWVGKVAPATHMREQPGTRVGVQELMSGQAPPNVRLRSGDTIYVPRRITGYAALFGR